MQNLSYYLAELHTLSSIPPNTYIHKNRDGHFISTGDFASNISGTQTVANLYKGHSLKQSAEDIKLFAQELISSLEQSTKEALKGEGSDKKRVFRSLIFINQTINQAVSGKELGWGLSGLPTTYASVDGCKELFDQATQTMIKSGFAFLKMVSDNISDEVLAELAVCHVHPPAPPYCPEEEYTDKEWEEAMQASAALKSEMTGVMQYYGRYSIGLLYNQSLNLISSMLPRQSGWDWWNKIGTFEKGSLYLGALPVTTLGKDDLKSFEVIGIGAILSAVEVFENHSEGFLTTPIPPDAYISKNMKHLQIPTTDCHTIYFELILRGIAFIHWNLVNGINILIHCKAGRGRSALIIMCYLVKHHGFSAEEAFTLVKEKRPQAGFKRTSDEWKTLELFERFYSKAVKKLESFEIAKAPMKEISFPQDLK